MNSHLINEINRVVMPDDHYYFLGDWIFGQDKVKNIIELRNKINCNNIYTIWGNHDEVIREYQEVRNLFKWSGDYFQGHINDKRMTLMHFAMKVWEKSHKGAWHLYGHSHSTLPDDPNSLSIDVGVDSELFGHKRFTPYSFEEIKHIMETYKKFLPVDHHNKETK